MDNSNTSNYKNQQPTSNAIKQPATGDAYQSQPMGTTATTTITTTLNQQQPQQFQPPNYQQQQASDINENNANQQAPAANTYADQQNNYQPPIYDNNNNQPMTDIKRPFSNDVKQAGDSSYANANVGSSKVPDYGANTAGPTPMQKEQEELRQQQTNAKASGGYPGVVGGTPAEARGIQGYDAQGNPIIPQFVAQRHQIEEGLGPTCKDGGYHDLRMMLTGSSLLMAFLIIPYCCGYRGTRICTCKKCDKKFPNIVLPSAPPA